MESLISPLYDFKEYEDIKNLLKTSNHPIHITGCIESQLEHFIYALSGGFNIKVIITFDEHKAKEIFENFRLYDREAVLYPAKDLIFYNADIHGSFIVKQRLDVIKRLIEQKPFTIITTIDALMDKILPLELIAKSILRYSVGDVLDTQNAKKEFIKLGYERVSQVEIPGQFCVRGSIIDIFSPTEDVPYRIDLWDEEIDSIKSFDVESQRSIENLKEIVIYPASEFILSEEDIQNGLSEIKRESSESQNAFRKIMKTEESYRLKTIINEFCEQISISSNNVAIDSYIDYFYKNNVSFIDYFRDLQKVIYFVDEPNRIYERANAVYKEFTESMLNRLEKGYILPGQTNILYPPQPIIDSIGQRKCLLFSGLDQSLKGFEALDKKNIQAKNVNSYNSSFELLVKDLKRYIGKGYKIILLSASRTRASRLAMNLREFNLNAFFTDNESKKINAGEIMVTQGNLHKGFEYPSIKLVIISETDIFGNKKQRKRKKTNYSGEKITSFSDLNIGDYVVHENHGLGIYRGIEKIETDKIAKDYIKIEYANNGNLYILATGLDVIQKYADSDAKKPKLNKLGSAEWVKTKTRVRGAVKDIAKDLVNLYAVRQAKDGYSFSADTVWQQEFEEMFPYEETQDQLLAIEATKKDMESKKIMDRLICGDVGYGKTEVAIRAAFKAVQDGKQVAMLVPTTILAWQHFNNIAERMKNYPIRVEILSRFRTATEQNKVISDLSKGVVDIVIGTHRLLSEDVKFKNLGLLIIDEEQRFGVIHKEKIKKMKDNVDVLTLTATPIPRTLHMSLIGIRDMSILEEPPIDRVPIQTYVMEYNEEMIREAISREVSRDGQVYYVYNRVNDIDEITDKIASLVPKFRVKFAHGQMNERQLEKIMYEFISGEIDVLVTTTIIETGLDIPNVNTMIIHDADNFGLSQLYQLRGRVGRSNKTAYAFLLYKRDKALKETAEKRLKAIKEFTELGSGFKISLKDLEIRGAGNILGSKQHGHMEAVGYDLYCKMLNEAVKSLKGLKTEEDFETTVDLDVDAYIPSSYIKNEYQKLEIYKKIAGITGEEEYEDMQDELIDRFGDIPKTVHNLLTVALIKSMAHKRYIVEVSNKNKWIKLIMYEKASVNVGKIPEIIQKYNKKMTITPDKNPYFTYFLDETLHDINKLKEIILMLLQDIDFILEEDYGSLQ